ncbi:MAG: hypothetical protein M1818_000401 [Claussenomyces sp. TS43310]|nr:MAG: hypothetical protein M1818_000401 [Claussenomyces sp. TS43310]
MSSQDAGRQSPEPERQSGKQQTDSTSAGTGVNDSSNTNSNKDTSKSELDSLSSNPKGPLDDHVKETAAKTVENTKS